MELFTKHEVKAAIFLGYILGSVVTSGIILFLLITKPEEKNMEEILSAIENHPWSFIGFAIFILAITSIIGESIKRRDNE